jgi:hypothetical protein
VTPSRWRRVALAGLATLAACGTARAVVAAAPRVPPVASPLRASAPPAPVTTVPVTTVPVTMAAPPATATPPPTTVAPATPAIATHDATLGALPAGAGPVPVAVDAGATAAISGAVVPAGVDAGTGELAIPAEAKVVAWYRYGPAPGQPGSAVLAGHVDWHGVPGIFFTLRELQPGDPVTVTMSDGAVLGFHVVDVRMVDKPELPRTEVFARTGAPTLTLVTCGGQFDSSTHHYLSNVVVTAVPD